MSQAGELVERTFEVDVPAERAWQLLADVARWPEWAPHITSASVDPPGAVGPTSKGVFRFRPVGRAAFEMTAWDPPRSWTWTGHVMGVTIEYDHAFEKIDQTRSRLRWVVRTASGRRGVRARVFAVIYSPLIERAWPAFARWAEQPDAP
jgi:carbon monoxide dehydrogenase subunit G